MVRASARDLLIGSEEGCRKAGSRLLATYNAMCPQGEVAEIETALDLGRLIQKITQIRDEHGRPLPADFWRGFADP